MQVYLVTWKGQLGQPDAFRNFLDIEPSIRISYGAFKNLEIKSTPKAVGGPVFTVTYDNAEGERVSEELTVTRLSVYDSPTHL